jgi:dipeptidyl aminopeptidase/acylaminoacyl peptidase
MILVSGGDLFRYDLDAKKIIRLTKTKEVERAVQYLPDGSGYTYLSGNALIKVDFGSHLIEQIDPKLPAGEDMNGYQLSPDGRHIAFVTTKGQNYWSKGRRVNIVSYRNRFAEVRQVMRHMPDDPMPDVDWSVYIYSLDDHMNEMGRLSKVFSVHQNRPRDRVSTPNWDPDSSRIAFAAYSQESGVVQILEAELPEEENETAHEDNDQTSAGPEAGATVDAPPAESKQNGKDRKDEKHEDTEAADYIEQKFEKPDQLDEADVVYRFLHNGGPQTPYMIDPEYLPDGRRMVFLTELSGFRHVHVLNPLYEQLEQLTRGRFEIYPFDMSKDHRWMFATATKEHPAQSDVYRVDLTTGELTRLSPRDGFYSTVAISNDAQQVLANFVDFGFPRELVAITVGEPEQKVITDSHPEEAHELTEPAPKFFTYTNRHGHEIHGHMFKPDDWSPDDKRPLLIYVYGGPLGTRKMATRGSFSSDSYFFAYYMAKKHGYVTCTIDPRGTSGYGGLYEKSNFEQVGKPQVEDLVDAVAWFVEHHGVDSERVGIHGWSFGGFQTQMCLYTEPDVFACGIAGAGPTEWHNYNSWYSTGTIGRNREGKTDLEEFSLLPLAKNLKSKLLLVHGMEDSNVLYQDTVRMYRELLKAGKETLVELFLDPTGGHGLGGDVNRLRRMRKYEEFLLRVLGQGAPTTSASAETEPVDEVGSAKNVSANVTGQVDRRQRIAPK